MDGPLRDDEIRRAASDSNAGAPRWVKVFGIIGLLLVVTFAILHLTGNGFGRHMHGGSDRPVEQRGE